MVDKSKQMVGLSWYNFISRQWIEEIKSEAKLWTDEQWEVFVDYCENSTTEEEFDENFAYALHNFPELEKNLKLYEEAWLVEHGNPYPLDKDGNNTQENK
jgi:hypothetical protein